MTSPQQAGRDAAASVKASGGSSLECQRAYTAAYNKAKRGEKSAKFPEAIKAYEKARLEAIAHNISEKDAIKIAKVAYNKVYRLLDKARLLQSAKDYRRDNAEKLVDYRKRTKDRKNEWERNKRQSDPIYSLACRRRTRRWIALRGAIKGSEKNLEASLQRNFNCSRSELIRWIEGSLPEGLTIERALASGYQLDEIRPCSSFNLLDPLQVSVCFDYRNCHLITKAENLKKHKSYTQLDESAWMAHMKAHGYTGYLFPLFDVEEDINPSLAWLQPVKRQPIY